MNSNNSTSKFNSYMIVYEKHKQRLENYENISKILNCEKFQRY